MPRLKVFVTPIGFHDAYVAAPSQKAALEAWGAESNLFARGVAAIVTDEKLAEAPLAEPGKIIKRLRGTEAEQIAALGKDPIRPKARGPAPGRKDRAGQKPRRPRSAETSKAKKLRPKPSRKTVDAFDDRIAAAEKRFLDGERALVAQLEQLQQRRKMLRDDRDKAIAKLQRQQEAAREKYQAAVEKWASD